MQFGEHRQPCEKSCRPELRERKLYLTNIGENGVKKWTGMNPQMKQWNL